MATPAAPDKALLFVGTLFSNGESFVRAEHALTECFGAIFMESAPMHWDFSDYYTEELGEQIRRRFVFFKELINQEDLIRIKRKTNEMEKLLSACGKRTINLDPGYLTPAKIVLASAKDYAHRIYLGDGIYAESTLTFRKGNFVSHFYTYRDFQDERYHRIFMTARRLLFLLKQKK